MSNNFDALSALCDDLLAEGFPVSQVTLALTLTLTPTPTPTPTPTLTPTLSLTLTLSLSFPLSQIAQQMLETLLGADCPASIGNLQKSRIAVQIADQVRGRVRGS